MVLNKNLSKVNSADKSQNLRLFGLPAEQGRWLLILLGMIVLLCLGTVYSWSIFRQPIETLLEVGATESLLPYTFALMFYSIFVTVTGFYLDRLGTRLVTMIGGAIVGIGYVLSSFATNILMLTLTYGVIVGTGVGTAYGVPMLIAARWFPDKKGLAVGLTIVGFGLSPIVTAPLAKGLIDRYGVQQTLLMMGIVFTVIILSISTLLKLPPSGWQPKGWQAVASKTVNSKPSSSNIFQTRSFYGLWVCYMIGTLVGLSAIGISSPVAQEIIKLNPTLAATSVSFFALFNGLSRPLFGWLSDRFQPRYVAVTSYVLILIATIMMMNAQEGQIATYLIAFSIFWFCLGGWLALAPATTLKLFNPDRYPQNYGIVFSAYGVGALLGTLTAGRIRDLFGSYTYAFYPMALLAMIGIIVAMTTLKRD
ncbi:Arabinose efflux permease family protein [Hyella patelloides LEGE 07179]|uniref:Arabinose efflux permease family protein n=1 Tax=Hyella patelloides LEGE 07179 TaxID=945734 RepID=A0A563VW68_9CYAN|nr:OFA family MFS transporter [Hyella patelloides]VEP15661.1 Arabinose efflux permease family protein [Hyella patelloides LEGE 07179]